MFRERRYWQEAPLCHFIIRDEQGIPIAHAALHEKTVATRMGDLRIGGIGDVCVHPSQRGRGLVKVLLNAVHQQLFEKRIPFGMLFGDAGVYGSSGYITVANPIKYRDMFSGIYVTRTNSELMIHPMGITMWPPGVIDLRGPLF
jgi:predicted N-acetyltransferase YhbS